MKRFVTLAIIAGATLWGYAHVAPARGDTGNSPAKPSALSAEGGAGTSVPNATPKAGASPTDSPRASSPRAVEEAPRPVITEETTTAPIAYLTETYGSPFRPNGSTTVISKGVDGVKSVIYRVTRLSGKEIAREVISETVVTQPVTEVVEKGTGEAL